MTAVCAEVASLMPYLMHLGGVSIDAALPIFDDGSIFPTRFPQLVADLDIFIGDLIPLIMRRQSRLPQVPCPALQVGGDDIPADPPFGEMIEGGHLAGKGKRMAL